MAEQDKLGEPWKCSAGKLVDADGKVVCEMSVARLTSAEMIERQFRIYHAVRTTAGIPTATLEALGEGGVAKLMEAAKSAARQMDIHEQTCGRKGYLQGPLADLEEIFSALPPDENAKLKAELAETYRVLGITPEAPSPQPAEVLVPKSVSGPEAKSVADLASEACIACDFAIMPLSDRAAKLEQQLTAANQRAAAAEEAFRNTQTALVQTGQRLTEAERLLTNVSWTHVLAGLRNEIQAFLRGESRAEVPVQTQLDAGKEDQPEVPCLQPAVTTTEADFGVPDVRPVVAGKCDHPSDERRQPVLDQAVAAQPPARTADECLDFLHGMAGEAAENYDEEYNIVKAELAALRKQVAEGDHPWQPLETAPRDGTYVRLWSGHEYEAHWRERCRQWVDRSECCIFSPTHWRPGAKGPSEAAP